MVTADRFAYICNAKVVGQSVKLKSMKRDNFTNLIQAVTGRDFTINTYDAELELEKEYNVVRKLPLSDRFISFTWKTPKSEERILRSFITAFCTKYREPNPACYERDSKKWEDYTPIQKEYAYGHHSSNMYNKTELMEQIQANFTHEGIYDALIRYGFYATEYGIGIFSFFETEAVLKAILRMKSYLQGKGIPYTNEFSDARWVYRFRLGLGKELHQTILNNLK